MLDCNQGLVILNIGGSNCIGSATGATALTVPGTANYQNLSGTSGAGGVFAAVTPNYPNPHGIAPGFLDEYVNVLGSPFGAITFLQWGVNTTGLVEWNATHGPAVIAECVSKGFTPNAIIHDWGGNDAQAGADVNAADDRQDTLYSLFRSTFGGGVGIYMPLLTVLPSVSPYTLAGGVPAGFSFGIWDEMIEYCNDRQRLHAFMDTRAAPYNSTSDGAHRLSASQTALGRAICRHMYYMGVLG